LSTLQTDLGKVATVTKVRNLGESTVPGPNGVAGQAAQFQVLSTVSQSDQGALTTLVKTTCARPSPPPDRPRDAGAPGRAARHQR
jgi:hypothetical protein